MIEKSRPQSLLMRVAHRGSDLLLGGGILLLAISAVSMLLQTFAPAIAVWDGASRGLGYAVSMVLGSAGMSIASSTRT